MILVTGANGFVGREVVQRLLQDGFRVRALVRNASARNLPKHDLLDFAMGDMLDEASLLAATQGVAAVVHLAAAKSDEKNSWDVNVGGARRLVAACTRNDCRRIINISTLSAKIPRKGLYGSSKAEADAVFRASGLAVTTLLPSVIYGPNDAGVFGSIVKFINKLPVLPVLGDGTWQSAPVHVGDVALGVVGALRNDTSVGNDYDIGGPELVTFDELIDRISASLGRRPTKLHVPFWLALSIARALVLLPRAPITVSNVLGSNQNVPFDIAAARRDLQFAPRSMAVGLRETLPANPVANDEPGDDPDDALLAADCRRISRYLLRVEPSAEVIERYGRAWRQLNAEGAIRLDRRWRFVRRHPWSLAYLDAAAALLDKESPTRKQILLVAAILEATPKYAEFYLTAPSGRVRTLAVLALETVGAVATLFVGLPLHFLAGRP